MLDLKKTLDIYIAKNLSFIATKKINDYANQLCIDKKYDCNVCYAYAGNSWANGHDPFMRTAAHRHSSIPGDHKLAIATPVVHY